MNDDINPNKKHLWARMHDEINGFLIFMTDIHEDYFLNSDVWMLDGTFRTSPKEYTQVLNIMGANLLDQTYLTVGHILLKSKKQADYSNALILFLSQVVGSFKNLRVKIIISDFEKALLNAIRNTIDHYHLNEELSRNIKIQGCLFHFSQCLIKTFTKYYPKSKITKEKKIILYVLLYSPFIDWCKLNKWLDNLLSSKTEIYQFLLYFKKVWLNNKDLWHAGDEHVPSVLTNCALESYHKRLNSEIKANPSLESFSKSLYLFDMKNFRELHKCRSEISKYQKFLLKKADIIQLMDTILNECKRENDLEQYNINSNDQIVDKDAESWCEYNESNNALLNDILFEDTFGNNLEIIDHQMDNIFENFKSD